MATESKRGSFGSKVGIILATAGSAVGLGNIWRFPYMTGMNGGAAFILLYFACVLMLGIPGMVAEFVEWILKQPFADNTTIGVVITNASFDKTQLCKIAGISHNGYARSIRPVHTSADGDSIYAVSAGQIKADTDLVGVMAAEVISEAIKRAVFGAESAYGYPAASDLEF